MSSGRGDTFFDTIQVPVLIRTPWFFSTDEVLKSLATSPAGLSSAEAQERLKNHGRNNFKKRERASVVSLVIVQFGSPLIFILIGAGVLTSILGEYIETWVITLAVAVNVALGFYREYHAENTLDKLATYIKDRSRVIRDGKEQEIDSALLVPGDIIKLAYGSRVPADARVIETTNVQADESILTGESVPVEKTTGSVAESALVAERSNMAHAGTLVVEGFATAVITATGTGTEIGKIADVVLATDRARTPIQKGVANLS
ncbi:MAG: HAD-IC family P-type ATPase, partial [Candidatus Diapherotrites archaeon]|nr:HAD-IC family P-type ATPase [Candidatus Diapherotrites archaeon]